MKKLSIILLSLVCIAHADVNQAVDNFFNSITADVNGPTAVQTQSAGIISGGGIYTRSQNINLQPITFTPPSFSQSCGNINFYSGSLSFMTNTDQLIKFLQNTLMTAATTAVLTALTAATPNISSNVKSMWDAAQKMMGMFNSSCQLGMALGNAGTRWVSDSFQSAKAQSYGDSSDASGAEINATTNGGSGSSIADKMNSISDSYQKWVQANANMNPLSSNTNVQKFVDVYGSIMWKGLQAQRLYYLPSTSSTNIVDMANLIISITGDIVLAPKAQGTGVIPRPFEPLAKDLETFLFSKDQTQQVYNCNRFKTDPQDIGECTNGFDPATSNYPQIQYKGGVMTKVETALLDVQKHFTDDVALTDNDMFIIAISPTPIYAMAQALDDIGMAGSINSILATYKDQIAFQIMQRLLEIALKTATSAAATRRNADTAPYFDTLLSNITSAQDKLNTLSVDKKYAKSDPVEMLQKINYLRSMAQNSMSPQIMQQVNFAKQMGNY